MNKTNDGGPAFPMQEPQAIHAYAFAAIDKEMFERAPCYLCGYNGPGYYQPDTHPCAAKYHAAQQNDGGPAFPVWELNGKDQPEMTGFGMTLRDYFAAKAMQGLLAAQIHGFNDHPAKGPFASMAYEMADAMLAAREM